MTEQKENEIRFEVSGFLANGISSGIKKDKSKDLALIYSETPAKISAVFTQNRVKAAPVLVSMDRVKKKVAKAVIINSGNANACTGKEGVSDAHKMANIAAKNLNIDDKLVFVASTGIIGKRLPEDRITQNIPRLIEGLSPFGIPSAAEAILTTDTYTKIAFCKEKIGEKEVSICGIAKGSGMIMPNMATMLAFILTDAAIQTNALEEIFKEGIEGSFNSISIDGQTSTNDMAMILANGRADNPIITRYSQGIGRFREMVFDILLRLAKMIVKDGEGATKFVEIRVINAREYKEAKKVAFCVANSNLVKTAFWGEDCNWGRIISAIGATGVYIAADRINIWFEDALVVKDGVGTGKEQEERAQRTMKKNEFTIEIDLNNGSSKARVFTTDLSHEYININANYRT
ncbi:MAG: bifunctional glutamate N-acetyltransferase/amino-acid acetyltransferase ArgJ [Thermodesulfobacteriota bacterium]|nr:bifunctional glutamate N-acetyltransferase/amino-acid acetyltransferase ArgJ [Thermodesulfobacteriota bacterium]